MPGLVGRTGTRRRVRSVTPVPYVARMQDEFTNALENLLSADLIGEVSFSGPVDECPCSLPTMAA